MPVHQLPISRRAFLGKSAAVLASLSLTSKGWGASESESLHFALLSDTHIPNSPEIVARDVNMTSNLRQVVSEVCRLQDKPAGVIISGDCAYLKGLPEDYANLAKTLAPINSAGLPLHLMTGNHDERETMSQALSCAHPDDPLVQSRFVSVLETPFANLFLLDSLTKVNVVTGELGGAQRQWLAQELEKRKDKPAIVIAHHNLQFTPPPEGRPIGGLADSAEFFELLKAHPQVKAYVFGHTHNWSVSELDGIQLINLPPVAYVFGEGRPNGWVDARLDQQGLTLTLHTIDSAHPLNGEKKQLGWG